MTSSLVSDSVQPPLVPFSTGDVSIGAEVGEEVEEEPSGEEAAVWEPWSCFLAGASLQGLLVIMDSITATGAAAAARSCDAMGGHE
jgi:hypothetical protein